MFISTEHQAIILPADNNINILDLPINAKKFTHRGQDFVAVRHTVETVQVLRNLGYKHLPPPILSYYSWPGRVKPMAHQKETAAFLTSHRRALCLNAPGTGKSLSALWAMDYLLETNIIHKVLIVAPLSTLKPVWAKELVHHLGHRWFEVLVGARTKRLSLLETPGLEIAIINHDGFSALHKDLPKFDLIIYDEATALKNPVSMRFRRFFNYLRYNASWLWLLTGTPIAQNPIDAWALAKLVDSKNLTMGYSAFKNLVMERVSQYKWTPRKEAIDICKSVLQPSIRFDLSECVDLPETSYVYLKCDLSKHQDAAFDELRKEACIMSSNIQAANMAVLLQKMLQVCCGVAYDVNKEHVFFNDSHRVETLLEVINEINDKCIVFVPLRGVQDRLESLLKTSSYDVASVHGDISKNVRDDIFHKFQNTDEIKILLAHPKVAAHGLTLTRAKHIIWYAPVYSLEMYEQANARIKRIGAMNKTVIYHIYSTTFEKELYRRLEFKKKVLSDFLSLVKGVNDES